jgi:hypothetical protein
MVELSRLPGRHSHAVYMNTQTSSIALLKTVIPASGMILSGEYFLGPLPCLRDNKDQIAEQLSQT